MKNVTMDRQTLYCIPVPGETTWVKEGFSDTAGQKAQPSTSHTPVRCKRSLDEDDVTEEAATKDVTMETNSSETSDNVKRTRTDESAESSAPVVPDLNFPLPSETGISCLVKIYDNLDGYQVNDVVEFIGVLSVDPALAQHSDNKPDGVQSSIEGYDEEPMEERNAHAPPPSLVPRLHAILANKLPHVNPYIPTNTEHTDFKTALNQLQSEVNTLRSQITSLLQHVVLGDTLAAEYLFCHLISTIYGRADVMPLGKFSVNLTQCPASKEFVDLLYKFISTLVTKSHLLPLTIDNMNTMKLNPQKDYTANRLKTGLLQLSSDTSLVVDETVLQPGQLDTNGVRNITSLGNLISWQKVEYDFSFHRQDFLSNVSVLILSEAKSILPSDCLIPLVPKAFPDSITEHFMKLDSTLTPELLNKIRVYLSLAKLLDYTMTEEMQKGIQEDFVDARKDDPKNMTIEDFHMLLNLVRLLSLTHLQTSPTDTLWRKAKAMEIQRKQRILQQQQQNTARTTS